MSAYRWFPDDFRELRISPEAEQDLAVRRDAGDREARNRLVAANYALALKMARNYRGFRGDCSDDQIISHAMFALLQAADRYQADFATQNGAVRFSTFACRHIPRAILRGVIAETGVIWVPETTIHGIWTEDGGKPAPPGVTGMAEGRIARRCRAYGMAGIPRVKNVLNIIPETFHDPEPEDDGLPEDSALEPALLWLASRYPRHAQVIRMVYGVNPERSRMTCVAIAKQYGLTKQRAYQMRDQALVILRRYFQRQETKRRPPNDH